jgi:signal transduction histidine kinase
VAYLYASFQPDRFLSEVEKSTPDGDLAVTLYEGVPEKTTLLAAAGALPQTAAAEGYETVAPLQVAGREWTVHYETLPRFNQQSSTHWSPVIFFSGIGISFLLFGLTYREAGARADLRKAALDLMKAQGEVRRLFEEEKRSRLAAEQASRAKDEFLAILSHELRTPLNAIAGWARILRVGGIAEETRRTALEKIERNLRQQTTIVDELLTYSDAMSRGPSLKGRVSVSEAFERAIEWAHRDAAEKNIDIFRENRLDGETIGGDIDLLATAIESVLSNAVKFSPPNSSVRATAFVNGDTIEVRVEDEGSGIETDFLPHVFEQYTQADHAYTRSHGGLGLGLPIARQIVKLHGGSIAAESEGAGRGSVFTIVLPFGESQPGGPETAPDRPDEDAADRARAAAK